MIKNVAKEILTKAIYPEEELIRTELDRYVRNNYKEDYKKNTPSQWSAYYTRNINGPVKPFYLIYMFYMFRIVSKYLKLFRNNLNYIK